MKLYTGASCRKLIDSQPSVEIDRSGQAIIKKETRSGCCIVTSTFRRGRWTKVRLGKIH